VLARDLLRRDHYSGVDRVQGLHDLRIREGALDLLAEAVVVADGKSRRPAPGEVEGVGDVDQHLACEVLLSRGPQGLERGSTGGAVEDDLPECGCVGECALGGTLLSGSDPCGSPLVVGRTRAQHHLVTEGEQLRRNCRAGNPCPENSDPHGHECRFRRK